MAMYQAGKSAAIFLKHKAKDIAKKAKKGTKKFYKKKKYKFLKIYRKKR